MKIFISWSGDISKAVAFELRGWLKQLFHPVETFMSEEDIAKGERWSHAISNELDTAAFGIICVTKDNIQSPWLNFEAGALSRSIHSESPGRVCTFLFGMTAPEVSGPLHQFQSTLYDKADIKRLVSSINKAYGATARDQATLDSLYEKYWPDLEEKLEPLFKRTKKKMLWAFETPDLLGKAQADIQMSTESGFELAKTWLVGEENPPSPESYDLLVYVYGQSENATECLSKLIDFAQTLPSEPPLLVYTFYASGSQRLSTEEMVIAHRKSKFIPVSIPETLSQRLKENT